MNLIDGVKEMDLGNPPSEDASIFGSRVDLEHSKLVLVPVPWEVTTSYGGGTSKGPETILKASHMLDLCDRTFDRPYSIGFTMLPVDKDIMELNNTSRAKAEKVIECLEQGKESPKELLKEVNDASEVQAKWLYDRTSELLAKDKLVGFVGGDHSAPLGGIKAIADHYKKNFGILHFDAHHDLRKAYEGFKYSHASIMYNILQEIPQVESLVSVAIRDFSIEESDFSKNSHKKITTFYDHDIFKSKARGTSFHALAKAMIDPLPELVYVSFDIDALSQQFCPGTGTPVPGGLDFTEACYILEMLANSGRKIIGFDLCEVAALQNSDDDWDGNVGSRILYKLCGAFSYSQGLIKGSF